MKERRKLSYAGMVHVTVALEETGRIADGPLVSARGFSEEDGRAAEESLLWTLKRQLTKRFKRRAVARALKM